MTKDESIEEIIDSSLELPPGLSAKELIASFVDISEMSIIGEPLRTILSHLADEARHRVILPSIKSIVPENIIQQILVASWINEIDSRESKRFLDKMVKNFPDSPFLRNVLSTYYLIRVYWDMSNRKARLKLLSYANEILKPLGSELPIREIRRQIEDEAMEG